MLDGAGQGACSASGDVGCSSAGRACVSGLTCVADRCERSCTTSAECPADRTCVPTPSGDTVCLDPASLSDAGAPEAGVDADAFADAALDAGADTGSSARVGVLAGCIGTTAACVIGTDHAVYCWGSAANGALGDGLACSATGDTHGPTRVDGITTADAIACGDGFTCAHAADGGVACWGRNDLAQLGRGLASDCESSPASVVDGSGVALSIPSADVQAGGAHACTLALGSGAILCWGRNDGLIDVRSSADPSMVSAYASDALQPLRDATEAPLTGASVTQLSVSATGASARMIISRDLYLWGDNAHYETATTAGPQYAAVHGVGAGRGTSATAGRLHRCVLDGGAAVCWGDDGLGQLGHAPGPSALPCGGSTCEGPGAPMGTFGSIATSGDGDTTCGVVDGGGAVRCWGDNAHGVAGVPASTRAIAYLDGATPSVAFPAATRSPFLRVIVGPRAACAVDAASVAWCWGDHDLDPATADVTTPIALALP